MIGEKLSKTIKKSKGMCLKGSTMLALVGTIMLETSKSVFAADVGGANAITSQDASTVAARIFTANQGIATAFGGALIGIAVVVIGIKMLMASKKQEARSEAMDSVLTVIIAALLIGGFAVFAGLFWGFGTK